MKSIRLVLLLLGGSWGFSLATQASPGPQVDPQMPQFEFVENKRQWADDVRYRADIPNGFLLLKPNSLFYVFYDREKLNRLKHGQLGSQQAFFRVQEDPNRLRAHGVEVAFLGANPAPVTQASGQTEAVRNYFTGQDASRWASDVHGYTEVNYEQLYPGIHLRLFSKDAALKYEYEVAPGSNPALIRAQYRGAAGLRLQNGDLVVETTLTDFSEYRPYSYQRINGRQVEVPSRFRLDGDVLSYEFPQGYDPRYPLVIDPRLIFSTYSGSVADNWGNTATFDAEGNLYSGGTAFATNFPVTAGAFDVSFGNADYQNLTDVVVMKFSPDGRRLLYATFLGGGDSETPHSMIVNNAGDLVVYGSTSSRNFPVSQGAFQTAFGGGTSRIYNPGAGLPGAIGGVSYFNGSDIFVSTLSATGNRLVASTYVGGNGNDGIAHTGDNVVRNYGDELR
ncbi:MAG: PKD domain containing protein, partial [Bernardetiaceae bacterium]|nr:PKD domain containing protein [Bernardetiaceae bacterium]